MALVLLSSCSSSLPWNKEPEHQEVNLAFLLDRNLVRLQTVEIEGRRGNYVFGSATPKSVFDAGLASRLGSGRSYRIQVSEKETLHVSPVIADLGDAADAIVGADIIGRRAVTIDYRLGMVTYQKYGIQPGLMTLYRFDGAPVVTVTVDGRDIAAIVDTTSPDTLVLPGQPSRFDAAVRVGGIDFGTIDVRRGPVARARIGNRLLAHFLVSIDYGKGVVGLFRDPREPKPVVPAVTAPAPQR